MNEKENIISPNCAHQTTDSNICISCGHIFDTDLLSYTTHIDPVFHKPLNYKYTISNQDFYTTQELTKILEPLQKLDHLSEIKQIVTTKKFKKKISLTDKIIITSFYLLKSYDHPVLISDFTRICKKGTHCFLKALSWEFPYLPCSDAYVWNVINRIVSFLKNKNYDVKDVNGIFEFVKKHLSLNLLDVIAYCIFGDDIVEVEYYLSEMVDLGLFRRTVARIKTSERIGGGKKEGKMRNNGVVYRVNRAINKIYFNKESTEMLDEIDIYIERKLLTGVDVEEMKMKTLKELKREMNNL